MFHILSCNIVFCHKSIIYLRLLYVLNGTVIQLEHCDTQIVL